MKTQYKIFGISAFAFLAGMLVSTVLFSQEKSSAIKDMVDSREYVFHAQTALPQSGASRQLTSPYDLKISTNSVVSDLPFYGRAYSVPYGSTEGGFDFTSKKFDYVVTETKKGGWDVSIKPKDVEDFREFSLSISENGYATLQVISNNRQSISFTGYISATNK